MEIETRAIIVSAALLVAALIWIYLAYLRRRHHGKRLKIMELFKGYFKGELPADQLGQRVRAIVSRHFTGSGEFYSLAIAAFQGAVDANVAQQANRQEAEKKLVSLLAALKNEFGLTDRYLIEGWRTGRE
jgi:hypothetical protein